MKPNEIQSAPNPSSVDSCSMRNMCKSWLLIMLVAAYIAWNFTESISITVFVFILAPLVAILQGALGILRYRLYYGDAPLPLSPAHGVVVVNPNDSIPTSMRPSNIISNENQSSGCSCDGGSRWRNALSKTDQEVLAKALRDPPIRLLVIGDSLAIGVGTTQSCTSPLPEVIAKTLSKQLGEKAVFWTCHGEPGAMTGWIVRELEHGIEPKTSLKTESLYLSDTDISSSEDDSSCDEVSMSSSEDGDDSLSWQEWYTQLQHHRKLFDQHSFGPYDITVVLTGSNDLKSTFFPFLLSREDVEFREQVMELGGGYGCQLRCMHETLQRRMRQKMDGIRDNIIERLRPNSTRIFEEKGVETSGETSTGSSSSSSSLHKPQRHNPMVVLPGMPARALPVFRKRPLRWLAVPIVDAMDNHKRALANAHPGEVVFVEAPTVDSITEFENQRGPIWEQREKEDTLLACRDIRKSQCKRIVSQMRAYYSRTDKVNIHRHHVLEGPSTKQSQHFAPPLSERQGPPSSKIFSIDQIHPNDFGYDYWGRHIGSAIAEEWKQAH